MAHERDKQTQINPGKAGPKGALEEKPAKDRDEPPRSGPSGNEGNNTRRDYVRSRNSERGA
ncbi:MAG TPA: hypothetical protein VLT59_11805 [Steroidobacteraceae bacterium]|nr:hypothetical protein [Steroidobacteraceae bacterium]